MTTGNSGGFELVLETAQDGMLKLDTPLIRFEKAVSEIGLEDTVHDASGELPRFVKVYRLPDENDHRSFRFSRKIDLKEAGDNPIYVRLTQEDGTRAWTSPIYVYR